MIESLALCHLSPCAAVDGRVVLLVHFYASLRGGGHPFCVVAACGRWGAFSHSTPKEVCVPAGQNYHHEIGAC